jgi:hypothetical protein
MMSGMGSVSPTRWNSQPSNARLPVLPLRGIAVSHWGAGRHGPRGLYKRVSRTRAGSAGGDACRRPRSASPARRPTLRRTTRALPRAGIDPSYLTSTYRSQPAPIVRMIGALGDIAHSSEENWGVQVGGLKDPASRGARAQHLLRATERTLHPAGCQLNTNVGLMRVTHTEEGVPGRDAW